VDDSDFFNCLKEGMSFLDILSCIDKVSFLNSEELQYRQIWYHGEKPWMSVFSCNLSFPRSEHSKYSELFVGWGIEDWDLSKRLYEEGYEIKFDESIIAYHIDYKPVISNAFRNNNHNQMVEFARNLLLFIDQYPKEDLSECAIALKSYEITNNRFVWGGDGRYIRDEKESINLIRNWLRNNNIYSKSQDFYIQKPYKSRKEIKVVDSEAIELLKKADTKYDQINLVLENLDPAEIAKILGHANLIQSEIKAYL
jgi:arsenate reductase-like glutaredoxin family protein